MLDLNWIIKNQGLFIEAVNKRGCDVNLESILDLDAKRRLLISETQVLRERRNAIAKEIGSIKSKGLSVETKSLEDEAKEINQGIQNIENNLVDIENALHDIVARIPNILDDSVPYGKSEDDNEVVKLHGIKPVFDFKPVEHHVIGKNLNILDFERAVKISGSRFTIMKGKAAKLERVLRDFMINICVKEFGYEEMFLPYLILPESGYRAGQLPKLEEDMFKTTNDMYLIPTAETSLVNVYADEILNADQLPIRMCAYSPCFRSEAGASGRDTVGMLRQHQFTKVEIVSIVEPDKSKDEHERMLSCAETILQRLGLHYRVVKLCSGDVGFCSSKTYDIEVWLPGQDKYREICSCSNTTDFQSRRARIRVSGSDGKKYFPHMLNSSALPLGRTIIAIMENYQTKDGDFEIPDAIKGYF